MKTRKEIDEAIEGAEYISGMGSFIGLGGEPLKELVALARLGAQIAAPTQDDIERVAYAIANSVRADYGLAPQILADDAASREVRRQALAAISKLKAQP